MNDRPFRGKGSFHWGIGLFASQAKGGGYYGPNWFYELKGPPVPAKIMPQAKDTAVAARLWDVSAALTGVSFDQFAAAA